MISSSLLGRAEHIINKTAFQCQGFHLKHSWGGIPVVIIAGDDFQLSGIGEDAHDAIPPYTKTKSDKNVLRGRHLYREFALNVYKLPTVRRVDKSRQADADLMDRVRIGERVSDEDTKRLMNLHLDAIKANHGEQVVEKIKQNAIYLYFKNEDRCEKNYWNYLK